MISCCLEESSCTNVTPVKRLDDLTVDDLVASPVWRYEGGSGAEAVVAPANRESLSQMDDEIFLAATDFELSDSSRHFGFCFPADDSGIDYLQPVILTGSRHVAFWFDRPASPEALSSQWRALGKEPVEIFPISFRCLVPVDGRTVSGHITGVQTFEDLMSPWPAVAISKESKSPEGPGTTARRSGSAESMLTARPVEAPRKDIGTSGKRTARRRKAEMTVEFTQGSFRGTGITGDVSRRGMFVRSTMIPGAGPALRLTVSLPEGRKLILTGRVVRSAASAASPGFGLRLADDWPDYEDLFSRLRGKPE
jgi:hypothetical protein